MNAARPAPRCPTCNTLIDANPEVCECPWCSSPSERGPESLATHTRRADPIAAEMPNHDANKTHRWVLVSLLFLASAPFFLGAAFFPPVGIPGILLIILAGAVSVSSGGFFVVAATLGWIALLCFVFLLMGLQSICLICH